MPIDPDRAKAFFRSLTPEQIEEGIVATTPNTTARWLSFGRLTQPLAAICAANQQMRASDPCIHWLLRRGRFKKKDFPSITTRYDYHDIAAFFRWCANEESHLRNINDLDRKYPDSSPYG